MVGEEAATEEEASEEGEAADATAEVDDADDATPTSRVRVSAAVRVAELMTMR
jgi:hypothetical protein